MDKNDIITLVGYIQKDNTFVTEDGEIIQAMSYRPINQSFTADMFCCINMRWSDRLNSWIIFQAVEL